MKFWRKRKVIWKSGGVEGLGGRGGREGGGGAQWSSTLSILFNGHSKSSIEIENLQLVKQLEIPYYKPQEIIKADFFVKF